jgi:hypothetical protein
MDRAFSSVTIKNVSEDRREFEGWASTPTTDRQNDQLMPEGARFELPLPFLLDHDHEKVVGEVYRAEASKAGIRFWARIRKIAEPGAAKDLVDYAWALIKNKLRPVVSVGFRPLEYEHLEGGGLRFLTWEWYELSGVGVAAQPEAKITATKTARMRLRAPPGHISIAEHQERLRKLGESLSPSKNRPGVVKLSSIARAALNGTLKINTTPRNKPGQPFKIRKINRTGTAVVKLSPGGRERLGLDRPKKPLPVVKLTEAAVARGKRRLNHRVVKLGR